MQWITDIDWSLFWQNAVAALLLAMVLSFLSVPVILRRTVMVGITLSQMAALGCAVGFFAERWFGDAGGGAGRLLADHRVMAAACECLALVVLVRPETRGFSREALLGLCWASAGALAVLLVTKSWHGMEELRKMLMGELIFIQAHEFVAVVAVSVVCVALLVVFFNRLLLVAYDREMAIALGIRAVRWDALFFGVLGTCLAVAIHAAGVLFTVGFLTLPGAAALSLARQPWRLVGTAVGAGVLAAALGFVVSHNLDLPTSPSQVVAALALFLVARGVRAIRR